MKKIVVIKNLYYQKVYSARTLIKECRLRDGRKWSWIIY